MKDKQQFTQEEIKALKELAKEKIFFNEITDNTEYNKKVAKEPKRICDFEGGGRCQSNYGKDMKCDGINTPKNCPWKDGGSFAMAVCDQPNRRNSR